VEALEVWSSYRPIDFLMFSPAIYRRLFQAQNLAWWPLQVLLAALAAVWLVAAMRATGTGSQAGSHRDAWLPRTAAFVLTLLWAFVAWDFLHLRFAPIFWVADVYALAFVVQAAGLLWLAASSGVRWRGGAARVVGLALAAWAIAGHALLAPALGRPWSQAEVFGLAPDPTVLATIAFLLLTRAKAPWPRRLHRALWIVPAAWCAISAATLATMAVQEAAA
jgi:hypothetical protein